MSNGDVFDDAPVANLPVGALDKAVLVDPAVAGEGANEADVRALGGFDGADPSVMGRMHVTNFKSRPFPRQPARPQGRQAPLVGNFRERIGLIQKLGELRGTEKLPDGSHDRLRVDQIVRHSRRHFLVNRHPLLDGPLHPDQADAELVLQQLPYGANTAVAQVVDIVGREVASRILLQTQQVAYGEVKIFRIQGTPIQGGLHNGSLDMFSGASPPVAAGQFGELVAVALADEDPFLAGDDLEVLRWKTVSLINTHRGRGRIQPVPQLCVAAHLDVELQAADPGEVIFAGVEEHAVEKVGGGVDGGRVAGAHFAINFDQRFLRGFYGVLGQSLAQYRAHVVPFREEDGDLLNRGLLKGAQFVRCDLLVGLQQNLTRRGVHDVGGREGALKILRGDLDILDARLLELPKSQGGNLLSCMDHYIAAAGLLDVAATFSPINPRESSQKSFFSRR